MSYLEDRNPFFQLRKEECITKDTGISTNKVAIINDETNDVLGLVSPGYELVTNRMVNGLFQEAIGDLNIYETHDHLDAVTRRWRRRFIFSDASTDVEVTKGDNVNVMLEVFNGYDARTAFGYQLMSYRWICENGMVMGKQSLFGESYAHYENSPEKLRNSFTMKFGLYKEVAESWREWAQIPFSTKTFETFVESRKYLGDRVKKTLVDSYEPILNKEKLEDNKWGAFNVLTYLSSHETKARKGSAVFSAGYKNINRAAADLYTFDEKLMLEAA